MTLIQIPLEMGHPIGTINDLADRNDLKLVTSVYETDELKWSLGTRAHPYTGFYLKRNEFGSIIELYGFQSKRPDASVFAVEPERRKKRDE